MTLEVQGLNICHHGKVLVQDMEFSLGSQGITTLLGPSGCGKSSVLRWLAGILSPALQARGQARLGGRVLQLPAAGIGYQPQSDALFPWLMLAENASLGLQLAGQSRRRAVQAALAHFDEFGLAGTGGLFPDQVSGGMRQRVAFLRSMLRDTGVVLLDEPFSALDAVTRLQMQTWLRARLQARPRAVLLVTHDLHEASLLSDQILVMGQNPGRIVSVLTPDMPVAARTEARMAPLRETLKSLLLKEDLS